MLYTALRKSTFFALILFSSLWAEGRHSLYLGEEFVPSRIDYQNLAQAIDWRFNDLENVTVISLHYSPFQRHNRSLQRGLRSFNGINLRFRARVRREELSQIFQCKINVGVLKGGDAYLMIYNCKNSKGLIVEDFFITGIIESYIPPIEEQTLW